MKIEFNKEIETLKTKTTQQTERMMEVKILIKPNKKLRGKLTSGMDHVQSILLGLEEKIEELDHFVRINDNFKTLCEWSGKIFGKP